MSRWKLQLRRDGNSDLLMMKSNNLYQANEDFYGADLNVVALREFLGKAILGHF
jgi:hypothetical protein